MTIPLAVSPGQVTPGLYLVVDLLAGAASPGTGTLRVALMGQKSSAGTLTEDTEVRAGGGTGTAQVAYGIGMPAALAAERIYKAFPAAVVDFIAPLAAAGAPATIDITAANTPTANTSVNWDIMGRTFATSWLSGETPETFKDRAIDDINQRTAELSVLAVDGGVGIVTINFKSDGVIGNDVLVKATLAKVASGGGEAVTGALVYTNMASGTGEPDYSNALSALEGQEYAFILPVLSNADIGNVATPNNANLVLDHINGFNTGLNAKLQQVVCGITTDVTDATDSAANSNAMSNDPVGELALCIAGRGLPGELAGAEVGGWLLGLSTDPAVNRIGEKLDYIGAGDIIADTPTLAELETALTNGVSITSYTAQGEEIIVRPITTHSKDDTGAPDLRLLDGQNVAGAYIVARSIRTLLPQEFPNAKITKDTEPGAQAPQQGVLEERDVKAFVIGILKFWDIEGVVQREKLQEVIDDGTLIVQVNAQDATQVDIVLPYSIVQPLAKFGVVAQRVSN